jgi:hypothetical protein
LHAAAAVGHDGPTNVAAQRRPNGSRPTRRAWARWSDERLLDLRLCDLDLDLERSPLRPRIRRLQRELAARGLAFRPHFWLSDEWFTPDGVPGVAVPFYLAHPRLVALEKAQMREVEGGTADWCMRILRHETGHAIENAFRLRHRKKRQALFGKTSRPYPQEYVPRPDSKRYVLHLEAYYAQSHPDEDFAETFAVWLTPRSAWRRKYAGWPALRKLEYVDQLMDELRGRRPPVRRRVQVDPLQRLKLTLRDYYAKKRERYGVESLRSYDEDLRRVFGTGPAVARNPTAAAVLRAHGTMLRRRVAAVTAEHEYTVNRVLDELAQRATDLRLRTTKPLQPTLLDVAVLLAAQTLRFVRSGRHRIAL